MNEHKKIKLRLIEARKAIRKKLLAIKLSKAKTDDLFEEQYKPITTPLNAILAKTKETKYPKFESVKPEIQNENDIKPNVKHEPQHVEDRSKEEAEEEEEDEEEDEDKVEEVDNEVMDYESANETMNVVTAEGNRLEEFDPAIKQYILKLLMDQDG
jgi:hypothetical protein